MLLSHLLELNDLGSIPSYKEIHVGMHRADLGQSADEEIDALAIDEPADANDGDWLGQRVR